MPKKRVSICLDQEVLKKLEILRASTIPVKSMSKVIREIIQDFLASKEAS